MDLEATPLRAAARRQPPRDLAANAAHYERQITETYKTEELSGL